MIFDVRHQTLYRYAEPVSQSHHVVHLAPRPHQRQRVIEHQLSVFPVPASRTDLTDYFGNPTSILFIEENHSVLSFLSMSVVDVAPAPYLHLSATSPWDSVARQLGTGPGPHDLDVVQYACASRYTELSAEIRDYAAQSFPPGRALLECVSDLTARIHADFIYDTTATEVATQVSEVLNMRRGVCQDFAHLQLACLRVFGLPGRYVSGYLLTRPPEGQERLAGADASHAWVSVWAPETGWVDFDPTNNLIVSEEHITIAYGRDFGDVSPISGVILGGGEHTVEVAVEVKELKKQE